MQLYAPILYACVGRSSLRGRVGVFSWNLKQGIQDDGEDQKVSRQMRVTSVKSLSRRLNTELSVPTPTIKVTDSKSWMLALVSLMA